MGNLLTPAGCGTPLGWLLIGAVAETAWAHKASGGQVLTDPGHREADIADALDKLAADPVFPVGGVVVDVPAASREATPDALLLVARPGVTEHGDTLQIQSAKQLTKKRRRCEPWWEGARRWSIPLFPGSRT